MAKNDKKAFTPEKPSGSSENAKKFKQSPLLYIGSVVVLVLVVVTFVGGDFLSGGIGGRGRDWTFGYYNKVPISWVPGNMFNMFYDRVKYNYQAQGIDVNNQWIEQYIMREAFDSSVVHTAILQMLKRSNYEVPEKKVDREVAKMPQFLDNNGRFSTALYSRMSESSRLAIWRQEQEELGKQTYFNDFFMLLIPKAEAAFIAGMASPVRSFDTVSFKVDDYPESEYVSFANENTRLFNSIHLSKITVTSSEREAKGILSSIKEGTITFEDAARNQSQDSFAERGGDMGVRYFYEIDQEITSAEEREKVYNLKRGELSNIIAAANGWTFFRVENEVVKANLGDEAVMERVRWYTMNYERGRMEDWAIGKAREFISHAQETDFLDAAYSRNLERHSVGPISINYGNVELFTALAIPGVSQQDITDMSRNENFWKNAFSTQIGVPCEPLVQGSNVYVFLPTDQSEIDEIELGNISSTYSDYWMKLITERTLQLYFTKHAKMDDRFEDTYKYITGR